jgi:hypothetical protein
MTLREDNVLVLIFKNIYFRDKIFYFLVQKQQRTFLKELEKKKLKTLF